MIAAAFAALALAGGTEMPTLDAKLPTPVAVYATANTSLSYADLDGRQIFLAAPVAAALLRGPDADPVGGIGFAFAAETLYHEWWHVAFRETNEKSTEQGAWTVLRYMLRRYWSLSPSRAQAFYDQIEGRSHYAPVPYVRTTVDPLLAP